METKKLVQILDKHINQEALLKDLVLEMVIPMIEEAAAKSETQIDDKLVAYLKAFLIEKVG